VRSYRANNRPKTGGLRMGLTWFVYYQAVMTAFELTGVWLGEMSIAHAVSIAPYLVVCITLISLALFLLVAA
jgi:hypothetical protein